MDHHNPSQEQRNQNRRRLADVAGGGGGGGGGGQNQLPHPPPQPCPRCNSNNTKFCYYNNYSLTQPRYFCKGCRRYWTQGGTLRSVPVGGGSRKRKRSNNNNKISNVSSSATAANTTTTISIGGGCSSVAGEQQPPFNFELSGGHQMNTGANTFIYGGGGGDGGFFSSLTGFPPVNYGPNLGLMHGLGLNGLIPQQHQQEPISFQELLHQNLQLGSIPAVSAPPSFSGDWIHKTDNNNDDPNHWPDFQVGNNDGLQGP